MGYSSLVWSQGHTLKWDANIYKPGSKGSIFPCNVGQSRENKHTCVANHCRGDANVWQSHKRCVKVKWIWEVREKRDREQRTKERGRRWADNQSRESSFHTHQLKANEVCACCGGTREKPLISFGSLRLHLTPSIRKGREAWSVHCHKINTDTKKGDRDKESDRCRDG